MRIQNIFKRKEAVNFNFLFSKKCFISLGNHCSKEAVVKEIKDFGAQVKIEKDSFFKDFIFGKCLTVEFLDKSDHVVTKLKAKIIKVTSYDDSFLLFINYTHILHYRSKKCFYIEDEIICPKDYPPIAWANHPSFYKSQIEYHIFSFIKNGMILEFSNEAKAIIPPTKILLNIVLPSLGKYEASVIVDDVDLVEKRVKNYCKVRFIEEDKDLLGHISRYLFAQIKNIKRSDIEKLGLPFPLFHQMAKFYYVDGLDDYQSILKLRFFAYKSRGVEVLRPLADFSHMKDSFDDHSLIFKINIGAKIVASGRMILNNGDKKLSEIASIVTLPEFLWQTGFVEFSRFATDPSYRGRDVFDLLSLQMLRVAAQLGHRYILADCEEHLLSAYKKRGAQELGHTFIHPLEGVPLKTIYYDLNKLHYWGRIFSYPRWKKTFGSLIEYYKGHQ